MRKVFQTTDEGNFFFGYYDKSPLNISNDKLLACKSNFIDRLPDQNEVLTIGYFEWKTSTKFIKLGHTRAWNWQQGCMLQWLGPDFDKKIIYNDRIDDKFVTVICDIRTLKKTVLPIAYYTVSSNGDFALSIDFERHAWFRPGYSYQGIKNVKKNVPFLGNDGIWKINFKEKSYKQIITLEHMVGINRLSNMKGSTHYLEHLMISPGNEKFAFLHRWKTEDGGIYARLYTSDTNGENITLINDTGRVSHFCWRDNDEIVCWGAIKNPFNALRKYKNITKYFFKPLMPLYKKFAGGNSVDGNSRVSALVSGDSYLSIKNSSSKTKRLLPNLLKKDGHPSFSKTNKDILVTDTYPDLSKSCKQNLLICDINSGELKTIDTLSHTKSLARGASRCDLHPKWSHDGNYICIDTLDNGYRSMYLYQIFK